MAIEIEGQRVSIVECFSHSFAVASGSFFLFHFSLCVSMNDPKRNENCGSMRKLVPV